MAYFSSLEKKKIHLKYSVTALILEALGILALFAVLAYALQKYPALSDTVPRTFLPDGTPQEWTVREFSLVYPIFAVFIYVAVTGACLAARRAAPPDRPCPVLAVILNAFAAAKIWFLLYAFVRTFCVMSGMAAPGWLLPLLLAAFAATAAAAVPAARAARRRTRSV